MYVKKIDDWKEIKQNAALVYILPKSNNWVYYYLKFYLPNTIGSLCFYIRYIPKLTYNMYNAEQLY